MRALKLNGKKVSPAFGGNPLHHRHSISLARG